MPFGVQAQNVRLQKKSVVLLFNHPEWNGARGYLDSVCDESYRALLKQRLNDLSGRQSGEVMLFIGTWGE